MRYPFSIVLVLTLAATLQLAPAPAASQETSVEALRVSLWPEYDRPQMLVMLEGTLAPEEELPATLLLPLPEGVEAPHAVAWLDPTGWKTAVNTVEDGAGGRRVRVNLPSLSFRLEYYDDLERDGDQRSYVFEWPGAIEVGHLTYDLQVPGGARELTTTPPAPNSTVGADGLTYRSGALGPTPAGQSTTLEISYERDFDALTAPPSSLPPLPPAPAATTTGTTGVAGGTSATTTAASGTPMWPVYVAVALLVGILIGFWLRRSGS